MYIEIDLDSLIPIYIQLKNQLLYKMMNNELKIGDTLPSIRSLASDLGIHLHTVTRVYKALEQDGYLEIKQGKKVKIIQVPKLQVNHLASYKEPLKDIITTLKQEQVSKAEFIQYITLLWEE